MLTAARAFVLKLRAVCFITAPSATMLDHLGVLFALIAVFSFLVVRSIYRLYFHPLSAFPGPRLAAISHLYEFYYDVIKGGQFLFQIEQMHQRYGPIVRINPRELHIKDPSYYNAIYAGGVRKRDKDPHFVPIFGLPSSMVATVGIQHHRFRRNILKEFFSKRSVNELAPVVEERALKLMERFEEAYHDRSIIRLDAAFAGLAADVIMHYSYGKSWGFLEDPDFRSDICIAVNEAMSFVHVNRFFPLLAPLVRKIPARVMCTIRPARASLFEFQQSVFDHAARLMKERESGCKSPNGGRGNIFEKLADPSLPPEERTLARLQDEALMLLIAGTETTSRALTLTAFYLAREPELWRKLREELRTVLPTPTSTATWAQLEQLPYLTGVVNEALLSMSTYFVHQDPTIFPEPQAFKPERWIQPADTTERLTRYLVAFNKGSRACLGMNLAYIELFMTVAYFVRRFDMELYQTTEENVQVVREMGMGFPKDGYVTVYAKVTNLVQD
ncbi:cytochrome P450 [Aspergillus thermomutatus]|uniref:Benzoate 4-monooxygenase cytochrome P450 n=1 Tax=Aspergillus thermomutatus TaxID=41047 RepID=A0A397FZP2_ASPTH|nr:uncharacterized protein CDV56_102985 [Aspergillus thermomutatus]RHZ43927.1 hypothetical protein CDV56_102985 [Aspergillus thermomutatus]